MSPFRDHFSVLSFCQRRQLQLPDERSEEDVQHVDGALDHQAVGELVQEGRAGLADEESAIFVERGRRAGARLVAAEEHRLDGLPVVQQALEGATAEPEV